jgi:xanthine dehydrogenase accessory factor
MRQRRPRGPDFPTGARLAAAPDGSCACVYARTRLAEKVMKELQAIVRMLTGTSIADAVLATLVTVEGSSYRRPGARILMLPDGTRVGSISGGCLEEDVIARSQIVRETGRADAVVYDTTSENDLVWGVGLGCHGVVRVLIEKLSPRPEWAIALADNFRARRPTALAVVHRGTDSAAQGTRLASPEDSASDGSIFLNTIQPPTTLAIFGAGDDAQPLARLAKELGWHVTVADPRAAFAVEERFPQADARVVGPADSLVEKVNPDMSTLAVVMTHHYVHDVPLLRALLERPLAYLGLLGPRKRADRILADIAKAGSPAAAEAPDRLHAPVGLDLGADSPEQVALAIIAEMQATLGGRNARPLRERTSPIHE